MRWTPVFIFFGLLAHCILIAISMPPICMEDAENAAAEDMAYSCVPQCPKPLFPDARALAIHEVSCTYKQRADQEKERLSAEAFAAKKRAKKERAEQRKRRRVEAEMQQSDNADPIYMTVDNPDASAAHSALRPPPQVPLLEQPAAQESRGRGLRNKRPMWKLLESRPEPPTRLSSARRQLERRNSTVPAEQERVRNDEHISDDYGPPAGSPAIDVPVDTASTIQRM
ncbi:hypothetical protein K474DRAFT_1680684, partial [Panus rudis PR-1116 ss-1]